MTRRAVTVDSTALTVNFIDSPPTATRLWAIASGRAQDELTEAPPSSLLDVQLSESRLQVNYGDDCAFCVVARPWLAFPPLFAPAYAFDLTFSARGYAPLQLPMNLSTQQRSIIAPAPVAGDVVLALNDVSSLEVGQVLMIGPAAKAERRSIRNLGPGAQQVTLDGSLVQAHAVADPVVADAWTPTDLGVVAMRREAITLHGRAVKRDALTNTDVPIANAVISVSDFWWTLGAFRTLQPGQMKLANPALRSFAVSVEPGLYAARAGATAQLAKLKLQVPAGDDRLLRSFAAAGDSDVSISDRHLLAPGTLLRIDPDQGDSGETLAVASVSGWGTADQPGDVVLAYPLRAAHRANARVQRALTPFPPGPNKAVRRDTALGDRCVFVADLGGFASGDDVQITGGPTADEYQRISLLTATSDANGYFRFPALQRMAALQLHATAPGSTALDFNLQPDYSLPENWLDVVFA